MVFEVAYDPGQNVKIVKAIQKYPVIYNHKKYPPVEYRAQVDEAWTKIGAELGVSDGYCKGRWVNIKGCYKRYLRNKVLSKSTKPYYLAEYMKFILPYMNLNKDLKDIAKELLKVEYSKNDEMDIINAEDDNNDEMDIINVEDDKNDEMDTHNELEVKLVDSDGEEESFFIKTSNLTEASTIADPEKNADWAFLSSLLPDVRKMNPQQKSLFQNALLTAVDTVLYGEDF